MERAPSAATPRAWIRRGIGVVERIPAPVWITLFVLLVTLFVWGERGELARLSAELRGADPRWVALALVAAAAIQALFALKLVRLLALLGHRVGFRMVAAFQLQRHLFATVVPIGGAPSAVVFARKLAGMGVPADDVVLALALYGALGNLSFAFLLLPATVLLTLSHAESGAVALATALFLAAVLAIVAAMARLLGGKPLPRVVARRIPARVEAFVTAARQHGLTPRRLALPTVLALGVDLAGIALLYAGLRAVGVHPSPATAAGGYVIGTLFLLVTPVFQGIGLVELSMTAALVQFGVPQGAALGATLLYRAGELWLPLVAAVALRAREARRLRGLPAHLPALLTGLTGLLSVLSVLAPSIPRHLDRLEDHYHFAPIELSRTLTLIIGSLLLFVSYALWQRKRVAWVAACVVLAAAIVTHLGKRHDQVLAIVAALNLALLLAYRRRFRVRSDVPTLRRGVVGFVACLAFALAYGTIGFWLLDRRDFGIAFSLREALEATIRLFFNLGDPELEPRTRYAHWFVGSLSVVGLLALAGALVSVLRPVVWRRRTLPQERTQARALIAAHGDSSLDLFKSWPDKLFFFSSTRHGVVSYRISRAIAVALGDPVATDEAELRRVLAEFLDFCDANGWRAAFHQATPLRLPAYAEAGLSLLKLGEEAIVELERFTLRGDAWKGLRSAVNRIERAGFQTVYVPAPLPEAVIDQLQAVSASWLTLPGRRERGFTLGAFDRAYVRATPVMLVADTEGAAVAFVNIIPDGVPGEATIDLMRHRADAPNGVMDALFVRLLLLLREQGFARFSLGLAPWAEVGTDRAAPLLERGVGMLAHHLDRFFSVRGLRAYKEKFHPLWEPRYLAYDGETALPRIALAILQLTEQGTDEESAPLDHPALAVSVTAAVGLADEGAPA